MAEISKTANVIKTIAAVDCLVELIKFCGDYAGPLLQNSVAQHPGPRLLATLCHMLTYQYPRVRRAAADGLCTCLLVLDLDEDLGISDETIDDSEHEMKEDGESLVENMTLDELVTTTSWDAEDGLVESRQGNEAPLRHARRLIMKRLGFNDDVITADPYSDRSVVGLASQKSKGRATGFGTGTYADLVRDVYGN